MGVILINLDVRLEQGDCLLGQTLAIDVFEHLNEVFPTHHALINLLVILFKQNGHLVDFGLEARLEAFDADCIDQA